jgi:hypothetical protein
MEAFWAVFTFGGSGPAITAHGSLDLKQEIQIQIQTFPTFLINFVQKKKKKKKNVLAKFCSNTGVIYYPSSIYKIQST